MDRNDEARIAAVIAEFGGDVDASAALTRMAEEIRSVTEHGRAQATVEQLQARVEETLSRNWPPSWRRWEWGLPLPASPISGRRSPEAI